MCGACARVYRRAHVCIVCAVYVGSRLHVHVRVNVLCACMYGTVCACVHCTVRAYIWCVSTGYVCDACLYVRTWHMLYMACTWHLHVCVMCT